MIYYRALPIVLIGGGFLICKAIFSSFPLKRESLQNEEAGSAIYLLWGLAFIIITGQLYFIVRIFSSLFQLSGPLVLPFFLFTLLAMLMYVILYFKNK